MLKNRICLILLVFSLILPVYAELDEDIVENKNSGSFEEVILNEQNEFEQDSDTANKEVLDSMQVPDNTSEESAPKTLISTQYKNPTSKKVIIKNFLFAMLGVLVSSFLIFAILSIYNKIRDGFFEQIMPADNDSTLNTPEDMNEAVKGFVERTKWE